MKLPHGVLQQLGKRPKKQWQKFKTAFNEAYITEESLSLLSAMLTIDHENRIAAKDALNHPYFTGKHNQEEVKH